MATRDVFSEEELEELRGFPDVGRAELDGLLAVDPYLGRTPLAWLGTGPTQASPAAVKGELEMLRVAASVKYGHATAALVVGKLCSSKRQQNALTSAIKEYAALRRTVYAARYLADESYRRRIARQVNKGENLHALRRELAYAGEGAVRRRHHEQQSEQMWCLTVATHAIVTWTTEYYGLAIGALRRAGRPVDDDLLAHIWPSHHADVNFYGTHSVDIDGELPSSTPMVTDRCGCLPQLFPPGADLAVQGLRPARPADTDPDLAHVRQE